MANKIPSTIHRELRFEHGQAIGMSHRWEKGQYCSILTAAGIVGCGIYDVHTAAKFGQASAVYVNNPVALHLRAMNMLYEAIKEKGSMVIVPSSAVETMGLGGMLGTASLGSTIGKPQ